MPISVRFNQDFVDKTKKLAAMEKRTLPQQIRHSAEIGLLAIENPNLTYRQLCEQISSENTQLLARPVYCSCC